MSDPGAPLDPVTEIEPLLAALDRLLEPLARLSVGKGVPIQAVEERMRQAFVRAARAHCEQAHPNAPKDRLTSRISTMTGLTRREVTRLESESAPRRNPSRSRVSDLFARWLADPACRDPEGRLLAIPRQGEHPSFESLAASVTRDVHPRALLDEMLRQELVRIDTETGRVTLRHDAFVPRGEQARMLAFLGDNVGDHLQAAVVNVLGNGSEHFEQALFADELSEASIARARALISGQWQHMMKTVAPALMALMDEDRANGRPQDRSLRLGLYSWDQPMSATAHDTEETET